MILWEIFVLILLFQTIECQRRITGGKRVMDKPYMVYLIRDLSKPVPRKLYDAAWVCGGVIIAPTLVLTSHQCLLNSRFLYVVSGYREYVPNYHQDPCFLQLGKRVTDKIYIHRVPQNFSSRWHKNDYYLDVGIVKVESEFDYKDVSYLEYCSYMPKEIPINYRAEIIKPGCVILVLGWGSTKYFRPENYSVNFNTPYLMGATATIMDITECGKYYEEAGVDYVKPDNNVFCSYGFTDRAVNCTLTGLNPIYLGVNGSTIQPEPESSTRNDGPCQNDHGGPAISIISGEEHVSGITSTFLLNERMECVGPYTYTGFTRLAYTLPCIIHNHRRSNADCYSPDWTWTTETIYSDLESSATPIASDDTAT